MKMAYGYNKIQTTMRVYIYMSIYVTICRNSLFSVHRSFTFGRRDKSFGVSVCFF